MKLILFEAKYYETYFIANAINNILANPPIYDRNIDEFCGDLQFVRFLKPFQKNSAFHQFIAFVVDSLFYEALDDYELEEQKKEEKRFKDIASLKDNFRKLPINGALNNYKIAHEFFVDWLDKHEKTFDEANEGDIYDYYLNLQETGPYYELLNKMVDEVFFIMFLNRKVLLQFHEMIAGVISDICIDTVDNEYIKWFARDGVLRRQAMPKWACNAVFYRDRGRCVICNADISNKVSLQNQENFDHIVPLARGGINDVTNLQLLCSGCNRRKSAKKPITSEMYERWYPKKIEIDE